MQSNGKHFITKYNLHGSNNTKIMNKQYLERNVHRQIANKCK